MKKGIVNAIKTVVIPFKFRDVIGGRGDYGN